MLFNKAQQRLANAQEKRVRGRLIALVLLALISYFGSMLAGILFCLTLIAWSLVEIEKQLSYALFLKEEQLNKHDPLEV